MTLGVYTVRGTATHNRFSRAGCRCLPWTDGIWTSEVKAYGSCASRRYRCSACYWLCCSSSGSPGSWTGKTRSRCSAALPPAPHRSPPQAKGSRPGCWCRTRAARRSTSTWILNTAEGEKVLPELQDLEIPAGSRRSIPLHAYVHTYHVSTRVECHGRRGGVRAGHVLERAAGRTRFGGGRPLAAPLWYLAEGATAGEFETWVLVQNPGDEAVHVSLGLNTGRRRDAGRRPCRVSSWLPGAG